MCIAALIGLTVIVFVRQSFFVGRGLDFVVNKITEDDTYYYLNTAWNRHRLGFATFDGVNGTNGVQYLWYAILWGMSRFFSSRLEFLYGALYLCAVLSSLCIVAAYVLGRSLNLGRAGAFIPAVAIAVAVCDGNHFIVGLENTLHLLLLLGASASFLWVLDERAPPGIAVRRFVILTGLLTLVVWTRLDTAGIAAILFIWAARHLWISRRGATRLVLTTLLVSAGIAAAAAAFLLVSYYRMGGSIVPVSGLWKKSPGLSLGWLHHFVDRMGRQLDAVLPLYWVVADGSEIAGVLLPVTAAVILWIGLRRHSSSEEKRVFQGVAVLATAFALHQLQMWTLLRPDQLDRGFWYRGPQIVMTVLFLVVVLDSLPWRPLAFGGRFAVRVNPRQLGVIGIVVLELTGTWVRNVEFLGGPEKRRYHSQRVEMARWIGRHLPADARLGAMNSGELGYFSGRSVTNLDGLINSYSFYRARKNGLTLRRYCQEQGIRYFVDYQFPEVFLEKAPLVHEQPLTGEPPLRLVDLREELSGASRHLPPTTRTRIRHGYSGRIGGL